MLRGGEFLSSDNVTRERVCVRVLTDCDRLFYLTKIIGYDKTTAQRLANERTSRRDHRSPSRHRE